jgi:simple sugar transport system permease protein|tara:strand:+ start:183 stop:1304 length:1122 start_codon:yes stop_codon:yes gene_type:complete
MIEKVFNLVSPRWKLQRRGDYSQLRGYGFKILAVVLALLIAAWALETTGESSLELAKMLLDTSLKSEYGRKQLFQLATPLIFNGAAMLLALRMQLFNVGLEGQLYMGAFAAVAVGLNVSGPPSLVLLLMFLAGMTGGALYALIPALMRVKAGVSEILTTLLLNPLAIQIAAYIGMDVWRDDSALAGSSNATQAVPFNFPSNFGEVNFGFILAVIFVIGIWLVSTKTTWGYEVTAGGSNIGAAKYSGMPVIRNMLIVMLLSGALAGISGMVQLTEVTHRFSNRLSNNLGWMGVNVAVLTGTDSLALVPWGLFLALILFSGTILKTRGIMDEVVIAVTGLILLLTSVGEVLANYRLVNIAKLEEESVQNMLRSEV